MQKKRFFFFLSFWRWRCRCFKLSILVFKEGNNDQGVNVGIQVRKYLVRKQGTGDL